MKNSGIKESIERNKYSEENIFDLYDGKETLLQKATKEIKKGLIEGEINLDNIHENPILEKYREMGATDTAVKDRLFVMLNDCKNQDIEPEEKERLEKQLVTGITECLLAYAQEKPSDINTTTVEELDFIFDHTGAYKAMLEFYLDLCRQEGFEATHKRQAKFLQVFPNTGKLLSIFVYA
jgi:hypothetical protein